MRDLVDRYAPAKTITAHLQENVSDLPDLPVELQGGLVRKGDTVRLTVPRGRVRDAAATLLATYPVLDVTIEEPDIGSIIEALQEGR